MCTTRSLAPPNPQPDPSKHRIIVNFAGFFFQSMKKTMNVFSRKKTHALRQKNSSYLITFSLSLSLVDGENFVDMYSYEMTRYRSDDKLCPLKCETSPGVLIKTY